MIFTIEISKDCDEATICLDKPGIDFFIKKLTMLSSHKTNEHIHFMTPKWGGNELTEKKIGTQDDTLINHLRVVLFNQKLPD